MPQAVFPCTLHHVGVLDIPQPQAGSSGAHLIFVDLKWFELGNFIAGNPGCTLHIAQVTFLDIVWVYCYQYRALALVLHTVSKQTQTHLFKCTAQRTRVLIRRSETCCICVFVNQMR